jgi:tetratricopeptide (TPR) repeat protein
MDYGGASAAEVLPRAKAHAVEAVRLDEALAEGYASLGAISQHDYDWATAERELKRAIELKPGYATAHQWYAEILWVRGGLSEALAEAERARQLDPTSLVVNHVLAVTYLLSGDYGRTIEQATSTLELNPDFVPARAVLVVAYLRTGKFDEALATLERSNQEPGALHFLRVQLLVAKGDRSAARRLLADAEPRFKADTFSWMGLALGHLALGDIDRTFAWLEQGVEARDQRLPSAMKWDPVWNPIRADPRFQKLLRRMNLE